MAHVFISYQRQDSQFARTLRHRIIAAGMEVWMDDQLHAGEDWRIKIDHAIRDAFALVVIMTRAAKQSEYVTYEWACAWGADIHVLPVLLERVPLHPRLEALQHRDFSNPDYQPFDLLIQDLRHVHHEYIAQRPEQALPLQVRYAVEELNSYKLEDRHRALDGLAAMPHPAAFDALKDAVTGAFYDDVRLVAALRVMQRDPAHCAIALPLLASAITDTDNGRLSEALDRDLLEDILHALRRVRDPETVPDLIALHNNGDEAVRAVIRHAVEHMGADAVPALMALLHDSDDNVQQTVSRMLIAIGDEAVPALIEALRTSHTVVRFIAAHILGEISSADAVPAMIEALDRGDTHLQRVLVYALGRMADPRAIPALITLLDDRDMQTVAATVEALSRMDAQEAVPALCHVVHRPEPTLKLAAIQALGRLGDPRAAATLIDALEYDELQFQLVVVEALARLKNPVAIGPLTELATHSNTTLRRSVITTLAEMQHPDSIPGLRAALDDPDPQLALIAAEALIAIGSRDDLLDVQAAARTLSVDQQQRLIERMRQRDDTAIPALVAAFSDPDCGPALRDLAADMLISIGGPDVVKALIDLLHRPYSLDLHPQIAAVLAALHAPTVLPRLVALFNADTPALYAAAQDTIERMGADALTPLRALLAEAQYPLRWRIVEMLGYTRNPAAIQDLLPLLDSPQWRMRWAAVESLGRIRAEAAVPKLIAMLHTDKEPAVQTAIETALERIDTDAAASALQRWRSPAVTKPLPPLDPSPPDATPAAWVPREPFRSRGTRKDTLYDDPAANDIDLFNSDDDREDDDAPRDWLDYGT